MTKILAQELSAHAINAIPGLTVPNAEGCVFLAAPVTLILGGVRSGKSLFAEKQAQASGLGKLYCATACLFDAEMEARVAQHKARRGRDWQLVEAPLALPETIAQKTAPDRIMLVDCLTVWLGNLLHHQHDLQAAETDLLAALAKAKGPVILVANEVGLGIIPANPQARAFGDAAGRLNQKIATQADQVYLLVAGIPLTVKGEQV